jgi:hypothetical protein
MRRSYVVPMRWMVIYEYEVPGGVLTYVPLNYPDHGHQGRTGNRTRDLMVSSHKLWLLVHEAGHCRLCYFVLLFNWFKYFCSILCFETHRLGVSPIVESVHVSEAKCLTMYHANYFLCSALQLSVNWLSGPGDCLGVRKYAAAREKLINLCKHGTCDTLAHTLLQHLSDVPVCVQQICVTCCLKMWPFWVLWWVASAPLRSIPVRSTRSAFCCVDTTKRLCQRWF